MSRFVAFNIVTGNALAACADGDQALAACTAEIGRDATEVLDAGTPEAGLECIRNGWSRYRCRHMPLVHRATFYDVPGP